MTTIFCMRAPGMTMFRMPIFTWNALLTSMLVLLAFPVLAAALLVLEIDRRLGAHVFDASSGGAILWQNLFWFFGHPEVYILALPFFGIATEIIPVFSRKPLFGYKTLIAATIAIAGLSMTVWAHHMFTTGAVLLPFFSFMTFLIAVPTGVKFFNWVGTIWRGQLTFEAPMLFALGFLVTFLFGGLTGVILASPPLLALKTCAPSLRSISSTNSAAASTGKASSTSMLVSRIFQVKIGIRNMVMPGARMQMIVVTKLTPPRIVPKPDRTSPMIHMSPPTPGE